MNEAILFQQFHNFSGHTDSVLCLQYDDKILISGSSDSTVRVWDVETGELINTLIQHKASVLHISFNSMMGLLVSSSKDKSIVVWDMISPSEINLRQLILGHRYQFVGFVFVHHFEEDLFSI